MTHDEIKNRLAEIAAEIQQIDSLPETYGLIFLYCDGLKVKPCIMGDGYVLTKMLELSARATDDFRDLLVDAVEELGE